MMGSRNIAIMFTDMVGFSRMTHENALHARRLNEEHQALIRKSIAQFQGTVRQIMGDGFFAEFASPINALSCAIQIQQDLRDRNLSESRNNQLSVRIGLHYGEVFEKDHEIFGDNVNITARLEPIAKPGGICFSDGFYSEVKTKFNKRCFQSIGNFELKNIERSIHLFQYRFPWEEEEPRATSFRIKSNMQFLKKESRWILISLFMFTFFLLTYTLLKSFRPLLQQNSRAARIPSSIANEITDFTSRVDLKEGWEFSMNDDSAWQPYLPQKSWSYAGVINGDYSLRKYFAVARPPTQPAIILGIISDRHRVYLNEHFVGGADHYSELALYTFDPKILKISPEQNIISIKAHTGPHLNPGLTFVNATGAVLGEFSELKEMQNSYYFNFFVLRNILLSCCLTIFCFSILYSLYIRTREEYYYSSFYILLGCLHLVYYNPWVSATFEFPFLRFLKVTSILLSSVILFSAYFSFQKKKLFKNLNNIFGLLLIVWSCFLLSSVPAGQIDKFVRNYNFVLFIGLIYNVGLAISWILNEFTQLFHKKNYSLFTKANFFLSFALLNIANYLASFKQSKTEILFSPEVRSLLLDIGLSLPFAYAFFRAILAVREFSQEKKQNIREQSKNDFQIKISKLISESYSISEKIQTIQKEASEFLNSYKSTLYLLDPENPERLRLFHQIGTSSDLPKELSLKESSFAYVLENKKPLLIENIDYDFRFASRNSSRLQNSNKQTPSYKSGTCLLIPLIYQGHSFGVLTFADKGHELIFDKEDLSMAYKVGSFISLLVSGLKVEQKVS